EGGGGGDQRRQGRQGAGAVLMGLLTWWILSAAAVQPAAGTEEVPWPGGVGWRVPEAGLSFQVTGPAAVVLEVRAGRDRAREPVPLEIRRDGTHVSRATLTMKRRGRGPK